VTFMAILQHQVPVAVTISTILSSVQVLSPGSSLTDYCGVYTPPLSPYHLDFLLGYFKHASLGIGQILEAGV
jgi:hypothetical protein